MAMEAPVAVLPLMGLSMRPGSGIPIWSLAYIRVSYCHWPIA
uniref:Uncharacterized protein n=1 Tax=Rhizophora mucronata TaxID=61149 RepID=A0A2P2QY21_RHIMU